MQTLPPQDWRRPLTVGHDMYACRVRVIIRCISRVSFSVVGRFPV